jgi:hypothetical protein
VLRDNKARGGGSFTAPPAPVGASASCCSTIGLSHFLPRINTPLLLHHPVRVLDRWGPKRASYIGNFWTAVNWQRVSDNYAAAVRGDIEAAVNPKGN